MSKPLLNLEVSEHEDGRVSVTVRHTGTVVFMVTALRTLMDILDSYAPEGSDVPRATAVLRKALDEELPCDLLSHAEGGVQ